METCQVGREGQVTNTRETYQVGRKVQCNNQGDLSGRQGGTV